MFKVCSKCGFQLDLSLKECPKCGVIFSKLKKGGQTEIFFRGKMHYRQLNTLQKVLKPLALIKSALEKLYVGLIDLIYSELVKGQNQLDEISNLIAFCFLSFFAVFLYLLRGYDDYLVFAGLVLWSVDYYVALKPYHRKRFLYERFMLQSGKEDGVNLIKRDAKGAIEMQYAFQAFEIKEICIRKFIDSGGVFLEKVGVFYRIALKFKDDVVMDIAEEAKLYQALQKAERLAKRLEAPVKVMDGKDPQVLRRSAIKPKESGFFSLNKEDQRVVIHFNRSGRHLLTLVLTVLQESGFFLFLLILSAVLIRFGMLLHFMAAPFLGIKGPTLHITLGFKGVFSIFAPDWDWKDGVNYTIAMGILIRSAWKLARSKSIEITPHRLTVKEGQRSIHVLVTPKLLPPVYIFHPKPMLLLMDGQREVALTHYQTEAEYEELIQKIDAGIRSVKPRS